MTSQEIRKQFYNFLNNQSNSRLEIFTEIVDEQSNSTHSSIDGFLDDIYLAIEEDHEEDDFGDYPTLKSKSELEDIIFQTFPN